MVRHRAVALVVLHEHLTGERHHRVHVAGRRDRTGEVRHDADLVGIADGHDLEHLRDAADVGQRRAGEVDVPLLDEGTELRPRSPLFAGRQRHGRQQPQLRDLGPELLFANRVFDAERPGRLHEPADFHRLVEVELLVQIDHPVAVGADALADLLHRLDDQPDARSRIEHRAAPAATPAASTATRPGHRRARGCTRRCPTRSASRAAGARQNAAVDAVDAIARRHRRRRAILQAHRRRFGRRNQALGQTRRRIELDVLARLAAEQLIERHVQRLALDVPQRQVDGAERVQPLFAGRVEPVHEGGLPDHLGVEGVLADDASGDVADRVRRPALADARNAGVGVDEDDHIALGEGLRAVRVVVGRVEDADPGDDRREEAWPARAPVRRMRASATRLSPSRQRRGPQRPP